MGSHPTFSEQDLIGVGEDCNNSAVSNQVWKQFLAKDVSPVWKRRMKAAEESVRVFTPYLDQMLVRLLRTVKLDVSALSVVTDLSPSSGALSYRRQLVSIRLLLLDGIEVRSLVRLHAKVLLVDGRLVTVGSQNFTSYARSSRETTAVPDADMSGSDLLETLDAWYAEAEPVDLTFVEQLLGKLDPLMVQVDAANAELVAAFEDADAKHQRELAERRDLEVRQRAEKRIREANALAEREPLANAVDTAARESPYRVEKATAWARLSYDNRGDYWSLRADKDSDLTRWLWGFGDFVLGREQLTRLSFYPLILASSGRMAFVRLGQTVVTYTWQGVVWGAPWPVGGQRLWFDVSFPESSIDTANMVLTARWAKDAPHGYQVRLRFDGREIWPTDQGRLGQPHAPAQLENAVLGALDDDKQQAELFSRVFAPLRNPKGFIGDHNASRFFSPAWHQIHLLDFQESKVLVARPA